MCCGVLFEDESSRHDIIGQPVGASCWIVAPGDHNRLLPVGSIGELVVQGVGLARGYLKDAEKTSKAFIENIPWLPHSTTSRRVYKTGDLVRYNADGSIVFMGRKDNQVKLRGQRIELGEIESQIQSRIGENMAVVVNLITPQNETGRQSLAAFVCKIDNTSDKSHLKLRVVAASKSLKSTLLQVVPSLANVLPAYMLPTFYLEMPQIPMTSNGKLDRKRLTQMASNLSWEELQSCLLDEGMKRTPTTRAEKLLQGLWQKVLGVPTHAIGADDDFFRLGGDSLLAMKLVVVAAKENLILTISQIFQNPRLSDQASATISEKDVKLALDDDNTSPLPFSLLNSPERKEQTMEMLAKDLNIHPQDIEDAYPCTPLQEGLMALSVMSPGSYVAQRTFTLDAAMDIQFFKESWNKTVRHIPILRSRILMTGEGSIQVVLNKDLNSPLWATSNNLDAAMTRDRFDPLDYGMPLVRYTIVEAGSQRFFVWTAHHAVYDGWCMPLIFNSFEKMYHGHEMPASIPFSSYIKHITDTNKMEASNFWTDQLKGGDFEIFPRLLQSTSLETARIVTMRDIPINRTASFSVTLTVLLRAAWALVVSQQTSSSDVLFGVTMSGRTAPVQGINDMIGPTISTMPLRVIIDRWQTVATFLDAVQKQATSMIPYEHFGLQYVSRLNDAGRCAVGFQTLMVVQPQTSAPASREVSALGQPLAFEEQEMVSYPLLLECYLNDSNVRIRASHAPGILPQREMEDILVRYESVIDSLITKPATLLRDLSIYTEFGS
jgi:hypothetical protein